VVCGTVPTAVRGRCSLVEELDVGLLQTCSLEVLVQAVRRVMVGCSLAGVRHENPARTIITGNAIDSLPGAHASRSLDRHELIGYARDEVQQRDGVSCWVVLAGGGIPVLLRELVLQAALLGVVAGPTDNRAETAAQIVVDGPGSAGSKNNARNHSGRHVHDWRSPDGLNGIRLHACPPIRLR